MCRYFFNEKLYTVFLFLFYALAGTYLFGEYWYAEENWEKAKSYLEKAIPILEKDTTEQIILAEAYLVSGFVAESLNDDNHFTIKLYP